MTNSRFEDYFGDIDFWMLNGTLSVDGITRQMQEMKSRGIRCFIARTYIGLESDYPGKQFKAMLQCIVENAAKMDMNLFLQAAYMPNAIPDDGTYICGKYLEYSNGRVSVKASPTFLDVFSPAAVQQYLDHAYGEVWQEFAPYFGNVIRSIWVDEPSFPRMKVPYSDFLAEAFEKQWHYRVDTHLSKLFTDEPGAETFRCHYWSTVIRQMEKAYFKPLQQWCNEHGLLASGHLLMEDSMYQTLCCGGAMMPFYKYFDIPGMDVLTGDNKFTRTPLNRQIGTPDIYGMMYLTPLQCVSAANQAGKKHVLCEMYGVTTENFGLREQKNMFDYFSCFGITRRSVHGLFYSLRGRRKRAYPPHVFDYQPYWSEYSMLTDECLETSEFVSRGVPVRDLLVIHPLTSAAAMYNYSCGRERLKKYDQKFLKLLVDLMHQRSRFDLGDEETIADTASVESGEFRVGKMSYKAVLLPDMLTISGAVLKLLSEFAAAGGRIFVQGSLPTLLDGYPAAEKIAEQLAGYEQLQEVAQLQYLNSDYTLKTDDPTALLINQRQDGLEKLFFVHNTDFQNEHGFELQVDSMQLFEQRGRKLYALPGNKATVPEGGSIRLVAKPGRTEVPAAELQSCKKVMTLSGNWQLAGGSEKNALLMEFAAYRTADRREWSAVYPILAIQQILTEENYHGSVELKYIINCKSAMNNVSLALEDASAFELTLNGSKVSTVVSGFYLCRDFQQLALPDLRAGENELILKREFAPLSKPSNALASLYEKLSGCELENCYLLGDFSVDCASEFTLTNCLRINRNAVLSARRDIVSGNLTADGYPFYAGKISLKKEFVLPENLPERALLKMPCPDAAAVSVVINGKKQGTVAWFPYELAVENLHPGKNELILEFSSTLRNLIGPFHRPQGEYGECFGGYSCPDLNWIGLREPDGTLIEKWYDHREVDSGSWCESYQQTRLGISGDLQLEFDC